MEWGKQMEKHQENAKLSLYQNSNYNFERRERKTLIIDSINNELSNASGKFTTELTEPLIIDKLSDVYLESFTTNNCSSNGSSQNMCFLLDIDEFNINSTFIKQVNPRYYNYLYLVEIYSNPKSGI